MYKVLIVDDNVIIRKSIRTRVNWDQIDMEVIGEACDGKEAYDMICSLQCDIVITDIKMPKIDGLTLIEKTRKKFPYLQYIIISSFDDFKYTKQAILYKVVTYILKPINNQELLTALEASKKNINQLHEQEQQKMNLENTKEINDFSRFNAQMVSFLNNNQSPKNSSYFLDAFNYSPTDKVLIMLAFNIIDSRLNINMLYTVYKQLHNHHPLHMMPVLLNDNIFILMITTDHMDTSLINQLVLQGTHILNDLNCTSNYISCSFGENKITNFKPCFKECIRALYYRFLDIKSVNGIYYYTQLDSKGLSDDELNSYKLALELGVKEQAIESLNNIFHHLYDHKVNSSIFKLTMTSIVNIVHNTLLSNNLNRSLLSEEVFGRYFYLMFGRLDDLNQYFITLTEEVCNNIQSSSHETYDKIIEYIKTNYNKSISLNSIAETFYMNTNYLGQFIKKHTGQTFNQYINNLRIEQAKRVLSKQPDIKLNELAHSIGYADSQYFSKVFRKITGFTPTQYKKK